MAEFQALADDDAVPIRDERVVPIGVAAVTTAHDRDLPFYDWLDTRLRNARISQRQLAMRSGVHHSTISRLVRHRRTPSLSTAIRLARVLEPSGAMPSIRSIDARSTSPPTRVEFALRSDPTLSPTDVRDLMRAYVRRRARHSLAGSPLAGRRPGVVEIERGR
jgi:transcriptional regulator with XRE-family HTH domain